MPDWLPYGLQAVRRYRAAQSEHRALTFSHEQLVCHLARHAEDHPLAQWHWCVSAARVGGALVKVVAGAGRRRAAPPRPAPVPVRRIVEGLRNAIDGEERDRAVARKWVGASVLMVDEADRRYECVRCRQICYLSVVVCKCSSGSGRRRRTVCARHVAELCACPPTSRVLVQWYDLAIMRRLLEDVQRRATSALIRDGSDGAARGGSGGAGAVPA